MDIEENSYLLIENVFNFIMEKKSVIRLFLYNDNVDITSFRLNSFYYDDECILLRSHSDMNVRFYYNQLTSVKVDSSVEHYTDPKKLEEILNRHNIDDTFSFIHLFEANNERSFCSIQIS
ncbi:hypothetical protein [Exiguobacterium sp. s37]|uniref:hypothetical protein n=1 Tax=Exiguobacterium sp. s37 TaxID=2751275 RepID=UPI001BE68D0F|nr:hypothetical protein [Exiguobacterium sp. s37]